MQNFSDLVQGELFQIRSWMERGGRKMCIFSGKLAICQKWGDIRPRLLL